MNINAFIDGMLKHAGLRDVVQGQVDGSHALSGVDHGIRQILASREHVDDRLAHGLAGAAQFGIPATAAGALIGAGLAMLLDNDPLAGAGLGAVLLGTSSAAVGQVSGQLDSDANTLEQAGLKGSIPNPTRFALPYHNASLLADPGHLSVTKTKLQD